MKDINEKLANTATNSANRTFESRLLFIESVFSKKYTEDDIFKSCVEYKLRISYEQYLAEVERCLKQMLNKSENNLVRTVKKL